MNESDSQKSSGPASPGSLSGPDEPGRAGSAFPIVGVGASAGGLEAFKQLLAHLPAEPGMALILVQHLDPHTESKLPEIFATVARLPVEHAVDEQPIELNRVYVIPPNMTLEVVWGRIRLTPRPLESRPFMPIDLLMRSLAHYAGSRAVGVILSGSGTDGTLGMRAIKDADGITFAQDEESAVHDAMPRSAIASGSVDYVLPPEEIARELAEFGRCAYMNGSDPGQPSSGPDGSLGEPELHEIFGLMQGPSAVDFARYKRSTILRRVRRRMALKRLDRADAYIRTLQEEPEELSALYQDFLIRVTSFFRDPAAFETLQRDIFPTLIQERSPEVPIRIWVAGCSTGEEVYSLAITLLESLGEAASITSIKILATDVNEQALEIARAGIYVENVALDIAPGRLKRFFSRIDGSFQISKVVRDLCVFSRHDLTRDPPFARLDLITCRNLLIYLDLPAQKRVMPLFHYGLNPGGYLMLGPSETVGTFGELFAPVSAEHKIFTKKAVAARPYLEFDLAGVALRGPEQWPVRRDLPAAEPVGSDLQREVERVMLARYAPAGVLIDEHGRIVQFRGQTDPYLGSAPGAAGLELLEMAREGLPAELRSALDQARAENAPARRHADRPGPGGRSFPVDIQVVPLRPGARGGPRYFLALFEEQRASLPSPPIQPPIETQVEGDEAELGLDEARRQVAELRHELAATREYLQSTIEENEASTEELKSANEEILSSNEELQSTNEELQTAKEETQSTNEELSTVNEELNNRVVDLARAQDDLINLFASASIPVVMVGRDLLIRRFTPPAEKLLNLRGFDIGRPIGHIRPNFDLPELERLLTEVIETLTPWEDDVQGRDGRWYSLRIRPYVTAGNRIDGAVLALIDVDQIKRATMQAKRALDYAEAIVESVWQPLVVLDAKLMVIRTNQAFCRTFHLESAGVVGRPLPELGGPWADPGLAETLRSVLVGHRPLKDRELTAEFDVIGTRAFKYSAAEIDWKGGGMPMILLALEDVTDRKREAERELMLHRELTARVEAERANRKKDEFLAMLAHELRNPLAPVLNALLVLRTGGSSSSEVQWALQIMERQVRQMARLLDDLLDVSRVMRGTIDLRRERVELEPIIRHVVDGVQSLIESRQQTLQIDLEPPPTGSIPLVADPVRLEQILVNLLRNAAKYTPEGGQIWLSAILEGAEVVVRVRDNGIGIEPDQLHEVFELFMQVDNSLDRSLGGLGIGLTLVKTLVELHGGSIEAKSEGPGRGSEFIVRLPAAVDVIRQAEEGNTDKNAEEVPPRRVLLVDDNHDAIRTLEILLSLLGHEVQAVLDGPTALEAVSTFAPDLVLLDLGLPGMDGFEVACRLRSDPRFEDLPIVALSGYGQEQDRQRSREAGFDDHAVKPVDLGRLKQLLRVRHC